MLAEAAKRHFDELTCPIGAAIHVLSSFLSVLSTLVTTTSSSQHCCITAGTSAAQVQRCHCEQYRSNPLCRDKPTIQQPQQMVLNPANLVVLHRPRSHRARHQHQQMPKHRQCRLSAVPSASISTTQPCSTCSNNHRSMPSVSSSSAYTTAMITMMIWM